MGQRFSLKFAGIDAIDKFTTFGEVHDRSDEIYNFDLTMHEKKIPAKKIVKLTKKEELLQESNKELLHKYLAEQDDKERVRVLTFPKVKNVSKIQKRVQNLKTCPKVNFFVWK